MRARTVKSYKQKDSFLNYESTRLLLKFFISNQRVPLSVRLKYLKLLQKLKIKKGSIACVETGRVRSTIRFAQLSRIKLRELVLNRTFLQFKNKN